MMPACDIDGSSLAPPETLPIFNVLMFFLQKKTVEDRMILESCGFSPVFRNQEPNQIAKLVADPGEQ